MKYTLGLDIGTNSIGWVLMSGNKIIDKGVVIFPIGTNLIKGTQEETKNHQRGTYRRTKRNLFRYKLRRKDLKKLFDDLKMLPDFKNTFKVKGNYQAIELYKFRAEALDKQIPIEEIGRIFLLINKHRGFKSNSKTLVETNEKDKEEEGKVKDGIKQLSNFIEKNKARTVGEYFHKMYEKSKELFDVGKWHNIDEPYDERAEFDDNFVLHNNRGIRRENGRYVHRSMYEREFDLIWKEQKKYYPQLTGSREEYNEILKLSVPEKRKRLQVFKETAYWRIRFATIFYQRQLKSQKKFIGKCQFEKNKRTIPVSSLLFQEFRILKQLADIRYSDKEKEIYNQPIPEEWRMKLIEYLNTHLKLNLREGKKNKEGIKATDVMDVLELTNKKNFEFNFDNEDDDKTFHGNNTLYAIHEACGEELFSKLKNNTYSYSELKNKNKNQLEALWHIIYLAKEDEWLRDTLSFTWGFDDNTVNNIIEMGLEEGFGSYSSKVLNKIIPFMKTGKDEYEALVLADYLKGIDEVKEDIPLYNKIKQLQNNELRNPVVEKAISQTIKLVNAILENKEYKINQEELTIRIESTREFKKPKTEREKIRRGNVETDKKREEYAAFLNKKREESKLKFSRKIYKNDSIINKFELWLEMGMDKEDTTFENFQLEKKAAEKHKLWLECNRICPYTGKVIGLSVLFSAETEIEHIIPYSRSLDDSFMNKTITFNYVNKEKGNLTAHEYLKTKGEQAYKDFVKRLKSNTDFNKEKIEKVFLNDKIEQGFNNAQINNTSYIAKYVRKKLHEVCRDVQFTNGSATAELRKNDWKLGNALDKVRYEEETNIDIDNYIVEFLRYKKDFETWRKKKNNSTDLPKINWKELTPEITAEYEQETKNPLFDWWQNIQKFEAFRGEKGKKDRSDHRHHLLDALITACTSRSIIQKLSTLNAAREKDGYSMYDEYGNITRERIDCPIEYSEIKQALKDVLIYHKAEQRLITSKINRIKTANEIIKQKTYSVRGSLVGDNFYGKLKNPRHQGIDKDNVYVKRINLVDKNGSSKIYNFPTVESLEKIVDSNIKEILRLRIEKYGRGEKAFSDEALANDPVYLYSLKKYPNTLNEIPTSKKKEHSLPVVKKVRVINKNSRSLIAIPAKSEEKNKQGKREIVNENRYAEADGNYVMALYESREKDKKGKIKLKRDFEILSFYEAVKRKQKGEKLFSDTKIQKDGSVIGLMKNCPFLKQGDMVVMYENDESEINWGDVEDLKKRLYKVTQLSSKIVQKKYEFGDLFFVKHNVSSSNAKYESVTFSMEKGYKYIQNSHIQLMAIKVKLNHLGKIVKMER